MIKFINVSVETHNIEDPYYTHYKDIQFYTNERHSDEAIKVILEGIKPKQYEDKENYSCGEIEIDVNHLIEELSKYRIYPLEFSVEHYYDLEED